MCASSGQQQQQQPQDVQAVAVSGTPGLSPEQAQHRARHRHQSSQPWPSIMPAATRGLGSASMMHEAACPVCPFQKHARTPTSQSGACMASGRWRLPQPHDHAHHRSAWRSDAGPPACRSMRQTCSCFRTLCPQSILLQAASQQAAAPRPAQASHSQMGQAQRSLQLLLHWAGPEVQRLRSHGSLQAHPATEQQRPAGLPQPGGRCAQGSSLVSCKLRGTRLCPAQVLLLSQRYGWRGAAFPGCVQLCTHMRGGAAEDAAAWLEGFCRHLLLAGNAEQLDCAVGAFMLRFTRRGAAGRCHLCQQGYRIPEAGPRSAVSGCYQAAVAQR